MGEQNAHRENFVRICWPGGRIANRLGKTPNTLGKTRQGG
jgi:hypothetical protein